MSGPKMYDFGKFARDADPLAPAGSWTLVGKRGGVAIFRGHSPNGDTWAVSAGGPNVRTFKDQASANAIFEQWTKGSGDMATDPPVSEAQRKAMFAAKAGKSNLGIPKSVGTEFAKADPGGKLPARKR